MPLENTHILPQTGAQAGPIQQNTALLKIKYISCLSIYYRVSLLSGPRALQLHCIEIRHPPVAALFRSATKETLCVNQKDHTVYGRCLPNKETAPQAAQMIRQNPTDPACCSAIVGDTKMPEPMNRTQLCDVKFGRKVPVLRKDIVLPSSGHNMKAVGFSKSW
jgi:hypothetical protein